MPADPHHIIKRCRIDLKLGNEATALKIQQRFVAATKKVVTHKLEDLLDGLVGSERYLKINKLEIDIGVLNEAELEAAISSQLPGRIEAELKNTLAADRRAKNSGFDDDKVDPEGMSNAEILDNTRYVSLWLNHFLKHGSFPWWAASIDFDKFEKKVARLFQLNPPGLSAGLKTVLKQSGSAVERLSLQFSGGFLAEVISFLAFDKKEAISEIVDGLKLVFHQAGIIVTPGQFRKIVYPQILKTLVSADNGNHSPRRWLEPVIRHLLHRSDKYLYPEAVKKLLTHTQDVKNENLRNELTRVIASVDRQGVPPDPVKGASPKVDMREHHSATEKEKIHLFKLELERPSSARPEEKPEGKNLVPGTRNISDGSGFLSRPGSDGKGRLEKDGKEIHRKFGDHTISEAKYSDKHSEFSVNRRPRKPDIFKGKSDDVEYYIDNAGLVVIAPFFPSLFKELKLLEKGVFTSEAARCRAVHIMQYAINNAEHAPENELILNKILCNIPVEKPIEREIELSDEEIAGVGDLLDSVIKHWTVLKGTSADGLREGFLQRQGKLHFVDNGWKLIVERKALDILLSKIPWAFSVIKLAWMDSLVLVEW